MRLWIERKWWPLSPFKCVHKIRSQYALADKTDTSKATTDALSPQQVILLWRAFYCDKFKIQSEREREKRAENRRRKNLTFKQLYFILILFDNNVQFSGPAILISLIWRRMPYVYNIYINFTNTTIICILSITMNLCVQPNVDNVKKWLEANQLTILRIRPGVWSRFPRQTNQNANSFMIFTMNVAVLAYIFNFSSPFMLRISHSLR